MRAAAATLATAALLCASVPAAAAPSQVRSALEGARAPVAQLEAGARPRAATA